MARYINIWKEKNVVVRKAYNSDFGHWITEEDYMVAIDDNGTLVSLPVCCRDYLKDTTADEYIRECASDEMHILIAEDCPRRDGEIKGNITEWICIEGAVSSSTPVDAICTVVALLVRNAMWKDEYSKSIDMDRIKEEYGK